ncbi:hypothetical protein [Fluviispira vulneris]|uniref:hypothetical protein n=1 Tax=Fluviispira vulneris TaxID=2763012 RepID=UPI001647DBDF|nr:hypothetical protein [Fluviispira vulneris]
MDVNLNKDSAKAYNNISFQNFHFSLLKQEHFNQAKECLARVFCTDGAMLKHLQVQQNDLNEFLDGLLNHAIPQQLSWIAVDKSTQKIVAVRVLTDFYDNYLPQSPLTKELTIIKDLITTLYDIESEELNVQKNTLLHTWMTAVEKDYQKKGLLKSLYMLGSNRAKSLGFTSCIGEASNIHNLNFLKKYTKINQLNSIIYKNYQYNEIFPFADMQEHVECVHYKYPLQFYPEAEEYSSIYSKI